MSSLSIIILNYNTTNFTSGCLNSILKNKSEVINEIIVVDNNSTDRSIETIEKKYLQVTFYFRNINDGFAGGCNFGAAASSGEYLLFLNPDVKIKDEIFSPMVKFMQGNPDAGILSGVMCDEKNNILYFYNKFPDLSWELAGLFQPFIKKKIDTLNTIPEIKNKINFNADWFHGAFLFIRKIDFDALKGFNENYFMYYEDTELCFRMKNVLGKNNICISDISYYHSTKSSLADEKTDDIYTFHLNRSKLIFINNYSFIKRSCIYCIGLLNIISRIVILPVWNKYKGRRREKLSQLVKVLKLYLSNSYLYSSKFEYIS